jgi:hypothetical protein
LPYLQLAMEVIEQAAPDLAVALDWTEEAAGWGLVRLFRWGLARCPDHQPPSAGAVVEGPLAARLIANAAGWKGDPEAFITALEHTKPEALVERAEGGIRLCGLGRYDAAWGKSHPEEWKAWKKAEAGSERIRAETGPEPERNRAGIMAVPAPQTQTQTQTQRTATTPPAGAREAGGFLDALRNVWREVKGADYLPTFADEAALRTLLPRGEDEVLRRWRNGLTRQRFPMAGGLPDVVKHWNTYGTEDKPPPGGGSGGNGQRKRTIADSKYQEGDVVL